MPSVTAFSGGDETMRIEGLVCSTSGDWVEVQTNDGSDQQFLLDVGFTG